MPNPPSFFDRQSPEVQTMIHDMAADSSAKEIIAALETHGVYANNSNIAYYRSMNNISVGRYEKIFPADTFDERVGQYIDAIQEHNGDTFANANLGCHGAIWSRCAKKLCDAGMIAQVAGTRPMRYFQIVADAVINTWYRHEVVEK